MQLLVCRLCEGEMHSEYEASHHESCKAAYNHKRQVRSWKGVFHRYNWRGEMKSCL